MVTVYLGLGSNLGDRKQNLSKALKLLSEQVAIEQLSSVYETEPVGFKDQPLFLNVACRITTTLSPEKLLDFVKRIETDMGRIPSFPNAPRIIDIDILFYGKKVVSSKTLTIPHPHLTRRAFVLVPLAEIAPDLIHPENGKTMQELLNSLKPTEGVRKWADPEAPIIKKRRRHVSGIR
jgi:2-amino-4-hydroxy-6-hydroxymethyldihydropteridine diphosphokinase